MIGFKTLTNHDNCRHRHLIAYQLPPISRGKGCPVAGASPQFAAAPLGGIEARFRRGRKSAVTGIMGRSTTAHVLTTAHFLYTTIQPFHGSYRKVRRGAPCAVVWSDRKMRFFTGIIGISLLCSPAAAQQVDPASPVVQSRKAYGDCVYESVSAQLLQIPVGTRRNADMSALGEQGFLACATEEGVLRMYLSMHNASSQVIQAALLGIRAQIKRTLRQIAADPEKYSGPQKSQATTGDTGGYLVQVASQRSEVDAKAFYRALQDKFPAVLGSRIPMIKRADLGDKGVLYRALVGPFGTPDEASQFCGNLRSAGGQCVVQRN
jgi:hypothetical protein